MSLVDDLVSKYLPTVRFREGEQVSASKLNQAFRGMVRGITVGPGLRKVESPDGSRVGIALADSNVPAILFRRVRITGDGGYGPGKYAGAYVSPPSADIPTSGALAASDLGAAADDTIVIINAQEVGGDGHWLTDPANTNQKDFLGILLPVQCDGKPVVEITGAWFDPCDTPTPTPTP